MFCNSFRMMDRRAHGCTVCTHMEIFGYMYYGYTYVCKFSFDVAKEQYCRCI